MTELNHAPEPGRLRTGDHDLELPYIEATEGSSGLDTGSVLKETGQVLYDPGFVNTAIARSSVTFINGDEGILRYRGYPIEQLAEKSSYLEVSYLLINGELPTRGQLERFSSSIQDRQLLDEHFKRLFDAFPRNAHPMAVLSAGVSALSTFYQDSLDPFDEQQVQISTARLLAKVPTIAAYAFRVSEGQPLLYPTRSKGLVENFLAMCFGYPGEEFQIDPYIVRALETLLILHADHEQNCSTSAVRLVGSSQANMFTSVSSGINALFGPLHGGANEAVMEMLTEIRDSGMSVEDFVYKVKNKEAGVKLMGFGHRVYKNYDPRAKIVKQLTHGVLERLGVQDERLEIAMKLEEIALQDDYFVERKLYPNVDFYTGLLYKAMGFPPHMFTALFALGRLPGWIAQWQEMIGDPETKIGRPRQVYTGENERTYLPMEHRTGTTELRLDDVRKALEDDRKRG